MRKAVVLGLMVLLVPAWVSAQSFRETALAMANQAPDLQFPAEAEALSVSSPLRMAIYKPTGDGPFPALVITHSCGGLRPEIREWTTEALARGYVVFVMDAFNQRGIRQICFGPTPVTLPRGTKDAFQALQHLERFPFVDRERIGLLGFSWGGMVGLLAGSKAYEELFSPERRFSAIVSLYPICHLGAAGNRRAIDVLRPDHEGRALVLMGEQDREAPPSECLPRLQALKDKGVPIEWHLYPEATHCWDCSSMDNFSKMDALGNQIVYRYDSTITADSVRRTFDFLAARMKTR